ncbi:uncharacterized protein EKO05_0008085 [Ascochyta rabiei]|uniref:Uncharacterized protein n=1 Tax=Didymella rabiei TaxID=5454 RepID=A0A163ACE8_DIDRA|nr:uncharacterized protein EKO05_0008085 [Ascochyta rabiei]KZM21114.1 hypothetical protein ST47_g7740 [Ascochyta rabiei]UPX17745.1 hypothetical protein EKO05_0008085 [Ascochyta rabiei]
MRLTFISLSSLALTTGLALPGSAAPASDVSLQTRQNAPVKPPPCVRRPGTTVKETHNRHKAFAYAFIYERDITEAFRYIAHDYINHNPLAKNGSDSAWSILSPIWASQNITVLRTTFISPQGWLNYNTSFGEVVDRFRWEEGCIAEHWDQGEVFPSTTYHKSKWVSEAR